MQRRDWRRMPMPRPLALATHCPVPRPPQPAPAPPTPEPTVHLRPQPRRAHPQALLLLPGAEPDADVPGGSAVQAGCRRGGAGGGPRGLRRRARQRAQQLQHPGGRAVSVAARPAALQAHQRVGQRGHHAAAQDLLGALRLLRGVVGAALRCGRYDAGAGPQRHCARRWRESQSLYFTPPPAPTSQGWLPFCFTFLGFSAALSLLLFITLFSVYSSAILYRLYLHSDARGTITLAGGRAAQQRGSSTVWWSALMGPR